MRIAIWENLPPGGAKRAAFELGRGLTARHQVDLYRLSTTSARAFDLRPYARTVREYRYAPVFGLLDHRLEEGRLAPRTLTIFGSLRRLHQKIAGDLRAGNYDVVLAHTDGMTQSPYLLRWLPPLQSVYFCQEVFRVAYEQRPRQHWRRLQRSSSVLGPLAVAEDRLVLGRLIAADQVNVRAAGRLVVNSRYMRERAWSAYGRTAAVCYLGVDPDRFRPAVNEDRVNEVLSVGSPLLLKGHDLVIATLGRLPSASRPRLRVIGQSSRGQEELERLAAERGVSLTVETRIDEASLVARYQQALATVCAARLEPFGLTALESMACGTPVVAIDEAGYRETVVSGETGILATPEPEQLAEAIAGLAGNRALVSRMGRAGRASVERCWTWRESTERLESILEQAVR